MPISTITVGHLGHEAQYTEGSLTGIRISRSIYLTRSKFNIQRAFSFLNIFHQRQDSKTCVKRPLKNRQRKILMTNGSLFKVESIAECSF